MAIKRVKETKPPRATVPPNSEIMNTENPKIAPQMNKTYSHLFLSHYTQMVEFSNLNQKFLSIFG